MGSGHVMRCLTLAEALAAEGWQCRFITRLHRGHLVDWVRSRGFDVHCLPPPPSEAVAQTLGGAQAGDDLESACTHESWLGVAWQDDAEATLDHLRSACGETGPDLLVVDHYALDERWERVLANGVGAILCIDDLSDRRHHCALLLDQNLGRRSQDYDNLVPEGCLRMVGARYALLREEFRRWRGLSIERRQSCGYPGAARILVNLGGADPDNITGCVLSALAKADIDEETYVDIVLGPASPWRRRVEEQAAALPCRAAVSVGVNDMAQRMQQADVAIGAAGATTWERCCLGLPALVVAIAENQRLFLDRMATRGIACVAELASLERDILAFFDGIRRDPGLLYRMSERAAAEVDGLGADRVVAELTRTLPAADLPERA